LAILDTENNQIVIRLIYDGSPLSGKTTSLKLLAGSLAQDLYTPEEVNGRTTYFDWVEYTGGLFEGYQIRCQIVSVPGQPVLAPRRQRLIASADVVVFVGDTTRERLAESLSYLRGLSRHLRNLEGPPIGIIFQANKRDLAEAVPIEEIQQQLDEELKSIAIIESVATEGFGIRHTFIFAVRLSLDRVRESIKTNALPRGRPEDDTGEELLRSIKANEINNLSPEIDKTLIDMSGSGRETPAREVLRDALTIEATGRVSGNDFKDMNETRTQEIDGLPTPDVPGGMIWPPVEGRIILHEVAKLGPSPVLIDNGDWSSTLTGNWRMHSYKDAVISGLSEARQILIEWAHLHIGVSSLLSPHRCLVLNQNGDESWRLWQVVRVEKSLRDYLDMALAESSAERVAEGIWGTAYILTTAVERFSEELPAIKCRISNISYIDSQILYSGLMPDTSVSSATARSEKSDINQKIRSELGRPLSVGLAKREDDIPRIIDCLYRRADSSSRSQTILESICDTLEDRSVPMETLSMMDARLSSMIDETPV